MNKKIIFCICFLILTTMICACTNQQHPLQNEENTVTTITTEPESEPTEEVLWEDENFGIRFNGTGKCSFIDDDSDIPVKFVDKINTSGTIHMIAKSNSNDSVAVAFTVEYGLPDDLDDDTVNGMTEMVILDMLAKEHIDSALKAKTKIGEKEFNAVKIELEEEKYTEIVYFEYKNGTAYCIIFLTPTDMPNTMVSLFEAY